MGFKQIVPWWAKIPTKILLSRLPFGYRFWQQANLFKHGDMEDVAYAIKVFQRHCVRASLPNRGSEYVVVEIGPGDTLFSAINAVAFGATCSYLIDVGAFARTDLTLYRKLISELRGLGAPVGGLDKAESLQDLLTMCHATYLVGGIGSFRELPDASVDFVFSQAVLQHVRLPDFPRLLSEMRRVLKPQGVCSHEVDLRDCLGGKLNNLRFSERLWESDFMACSGFYTNRIRFKEMLNCFSSAGFRYEVIRKRFFEQLPTPRMRMSIPFRNLEDNDLMVSDFDVVLRCA